MKQAKKCGSNLFEEVKLDCENLIYVAGRPGMGTTSLALHMVLEYVRENIKSVCNSRNTEFEIYLTQSVGDAETFIKNTCRKYENSDVTCRFYACGGDGTINECVNGIVGFDHAELAAIPIGTGNDFVRNFGSAESYFDLESLMASHAISCDLIKYNDRYSLNMINIGYDCAVVGRTARIKKNPLIPGKLAYVLGLVAELVKKTGVSFHLTADGQDRGDHRLLLSLFANGGFCGGGFYSNPDASLFDRSIDCIAIKNIGRIRFLSLVGVYKKGLHLVEKYNNIIEHFKCNEAHIHMDEETPVSVDGEILMLKDAVLSVEHEALSVWLPCGVEPLVASEQKEEAIV